MSNLLQHAIKRFSNLNVDLENKINKSIDVSNSFNVNNICATPDIEIKIKNQIINLNTINSNLKEIDSVLDNLLEYNNTILTAVTIAEGLIKTIKLTTSVIPTSVPPGVGIPAGVIINASDLLQRSQQEISLNKVILSGIDNTLSVQSNNVEKYSNNVSSLIQNMDFIMKGLIKCGKNVGDLEKSLSSIKDNINTIQNKLPSSKQIKETYKGEIYKGYTFEIIVESNSNSNVIVQRRYAVAKNNENIIQFQGTPSYSTLDNVLISELKLKIDQESV